MRLARSGAGLVVLSALAVPFSLRGVAAGQQQPVVRSGSQLVRVTVVVRDHRRQSITGLKADDFDVTENGARVPIAFFHERIAPPAGARSAVAAMSAATPSARFANTSPDGAPPNVTVILLDRLNTKWTDQAQAREALRVFLAQIRPEDRVAVYALDENALRILHDFTSDASSLLRAIKGAEKLDSRLTDRDADDQLASDGAYTTFSALQTLGWHLAGIPGRKNLVWISSGLISGRALLNNNDIAGAIRTAADDAEQHYEIDYYSPAPAADGSYRATKVTSRKSGVELQYRRGYFATAAEVPGNDRKSALNRAVVDRLEATGIPLTVTPARVAGLPDSLELSVTADGNRLSFANDQGRWSGGMDLAIAQIRADGTRGVDVDTTIDLHLTDAQHDAVLRTGLTLKNTIVLGSQTSRLAVVVRDPTSGAVGSVVIPAAKLPPAAK